MENIQEIRMNNEKANTFEKSEQPFLSSSTGSDRSGLDLFLISILALFMELLLIRWISTEINIFAYLQNTLLVVCFMGLGMGCLSSRQPIIIRNTLIPLLVLVALMTVPMTRQSLQKLSVFLATTGDLLVWQMPAEYNRLESVFFVTVGLACVFGLMFLIWQAFVPLGRILGKLMADHPKPIKAYSINIAGSLVGILLFTLLSGFYQPPLVWFLFLVLFLFYFGFRDHVHRVNFILLLAIVALMFFYDRGSNALKILWSPYQKLVLSEARLSDYPTWKYLVSVNNTWFQALIDLKRDNIKSSRKQVRQDLQEFNQYDVPFILYPEAQKMLVVGSGTGNDVAAAVQHSIRKIVAVEIDPGVIDLGRSYHPQQPYSSPLVEVVNDDARSFFARSETRFDVISFGYLDSHTTTSMTNARLDHYVYTKESFTMAKSLLADGGIVVLMFWSQRPFITERIAQTLKDVFGEEPIRFRIPKSDYHTGGGVIFLAGNLNRVRTEIAANHQLAELVAESEHDKLHPSYATEISTDNWPYLYLDSRRIPILYYLLAFLLFGFFFYTRWRFKLAETTRHWTTSHWHFFFLGAAFLLLEVQNISKASVVLGNTWQLNAVIISGILVMILLANILATIFPNVPVGFVYLALIASCIGLYWIDLARFAAFPYYQKVSAVALLTAVPVLFSGIVFAHSFVGRIGKDTALGANLIGSLVGGVLQSVTFITGIKALLLIVAALYLAAMLCDRRLRVAVQNLQEYGYLPRSESET
jgi:spermidine synthase